MKVLACVDFDPGTQQCVTEAWVDQSVVPALPTLQQGSEIGFAMLSVLAVVAAMRLLNPPKENNL